RASSPVIFRENSTFVGGESRRTLLACARLPGRATRTGHWIRGMISIKVPPLGESIVEATVARWLKKEGEAVAAGDTLVELETDKVTVEVPALKGGVLARHAKHDGDVVAVDDVLGEIDESANVTAAAPTRPPAPADAPAPRTSAPATAPAPQAAEVRASPAAKRVAAESGVDLTSVSGTGRGGVVSKPDVIERASAAAPAVAPARSDGASSAPARPAAESPPRVPAPVRPSAPQGARETREKMSTRRKRIAEHLLEAQHATAHLTTFNEADMSAVSALRDRVKERIEKEHGV